MLFIRRILIDPHPVDLVFRVLFLHHVTKAFGKATGSLPLVGIAIVIQRLARTVGRTIVREAPLFGDGSVE